MFRRTLIVAASVELLFCTIAVSQTPSHLWSESFGGVRSGGGGVRVASDGSGNVLMMGYMVGTVDFGGGPLTSAGYGMFIAKFDPNGTHLWSQCFGDGSTQQANGIAVDGSENVLMTGWFQDTVNFGGGPLTGEGLDDIFIAKFDPNGNHVWSQRFGDASDDQEGDGVAVDASGNAIVTGFFRGTVNFGGGTLTSVFDPDIFVVKFDPNGNHLWSKSFGDPEGQVAKSVAVDASGNAIVTGGIQGTVDFGGGPLTSSGNHDIFVAKFDPNGNHLWSKRFGDAEGQLATSVAVDGSGNAVLTGVFSGTVDFGGGLLTSGGGGDIFVVKFDPNGNHLWSQCFGDGSTQHGNGVAVDGSENVLMTGWLAGTVDFGGGPLTSAGGSDIFIAKFGPNGNHLWSQCFGDGSTQHGNGVAVDGSENVLMTGYFSGTVDFGGGPLTGPYDIFLAKFGFGAVPTLLRSFVASYTERGIEVSWVMSQPATGIDFHVFRKISTDPEYQELPTPRIDPQGSSFTFVDRQYETGKSYVYRVDASDSKGRWTLFETEPIETPGARLALCQNVPNPFNPTTTISFVLPERTRAVLAIYDVNGRHVRTLVDEVLSGGLSEATWDGRDRQGSRVGSGVYLYRLNVGNETITKKLTILK